MDNETTEAVLEPVTPIPRQRAKPMPSGELVIAVTEAMTGMEVSEPDKTALRQITRDDAAAAFLKGKFGYDMDMETLEARDVFSSWLARNIKVKPMLLTMHLVNLEETHKLLLFAKKELENADENQLDPDQKNALMRTIIYGVGTQSQMLIKAQKLAHEIEPESGEKKPKNRPPNISSQTNIAVYSGVGKPPNIR